MSTHPLPTAHFPVPPPPPDEGRHLLLPAEDSTEALLDELRRTWPGLPVESIPPFLLLPHGLPPNSLPNPVPPLAFARQCLPHATTLAGASIRNLADQIFDALAPAFPEAQPWALHLAPCFPHPDAGHNRCQLIRQTLLDRLQRQRRHLLRRLDPTPHPFDPNRSLAQFILTDPEHGFLSLAPAPSPHRWRNVLSPFPLGSIPVASDKSAPCRAFAKLVEAEQRLGRTIAPGESCVDLGASPGSWSYVALRRGAKVLAIDRSPLRPDLHRHPNLTFRQGDAFSFLPEQPVDWLICDVIATPQRSIQLALDWCRHARCRHFVVTIKFKGTTDYPALDTLKAELAPLADPFLLTRLCANKNEVCVMGSVIPRPNPPPPAPTGSTIAPTAG